MTILAPAARHFLVQASALSLAPLAPHLSSLTQPLTVALLPMSSNASADTASTKNNARQTSRTFFITCILLFCSGCGPQAAGYDGCFSRGLPAGDKIVRKANAVTEPLRDHTSPPECETRPENYTTGKPGVCQRRNHRWGTVSTPAATSTLASSRAEPFFRRREGSRVGSSLLLEAKPRYHRNPTLDSARQENPPIFSQSDSPTVQAGPELEPRTRTLQASRNPAARVLLSQWPC